MRALLRGRFTSATDGGAARSLGCLLSALLRSQAMADASYPPELLYHPEHDWARLDGDIATFGITWHAQDALGEVVFYDTPEIGAQLSQNEPYAEVESVKAVSDVVAPLSGEIIEVNEQLASKPEVINEDPYGDGWLVKIRVADASQVAGLLDRDAYVGLLDE
jgi:glycine cleavage system H protein